MPAFPIPDFLTLTVLASANLCPAVPPPDIHVFVTRQDTEIRRDLTKVDLQKLRKDTALPHQMVDMSHVDTGGVLNSDISIRNDINFDVVPGNTAETVNQVCVRYRTINITLDLDPTILIAREYDPKSCWYNQVLQHEESHIDMDNVVLTKYAKRLQEGMKMAFSMPDDFISGPVPAKGADELKQNMGNALVAMVNILTTDLGAERQAKQQGVDSLEGYAYIMNNCYTGPNVVQVEPSYGRR